MLIKKSKLIIQLYPKLKKKIVLNEISVLLPPPPPFLMYSFNNGFAEVNVKNIN